MNYIVKNILKLVVFIGMHISLIHPMNNTIEGLRHLMTINKKNNEEQHKDPADTIKSVNHFVTIKSKVNEPHGLLQLIYDFRDPQQRTLIGMNTILSTPIILKCFMAYPKKKKYASTFILSDPHSKERILRFKAREGSILSIEKKGNRISITGSQIARFIVREENDEEKEYIIAEASTEEKELAHFSYSQ